VLALSLGPSVSMQRCRAHPRASPSAVSTGRPQVRGRRVQLTAGWPWGFGSLSSLTTALRHRALHRPELADREGLKRKARADGRYGLQIQIDAIGPVSGASRGRWRQNWTSPRPRSLGLGTLSLRVRNVTTHGRPPLWPPFASGASGTVSIWPSICQ
jgi:hypothetical protein